MRLLYLLIPFAPLVASIVVGLWGPRLGRGVSHWLCILGVAASFVASIVVARDVQAGNVFNGDVYAWLASGDLKLAIGFLIDPLTALMMVVAFTARSAETRAVSNASPPRTTGRTMPGRTASNRAASRSAPSSVRLPTVTRLAPAVRHA